jgi:hypothetical protein
MILKCEFDKMTFFTKGNEGSIYTFSPAHFGVPLAVKKYRRPQHPLRETTRFHLHHFLHLLTEAVPEAFQFKYEDRTVKIKFIPVCYAKGEVTCYSGVHFFHSLEKDQHDGPWCRTNLVNPMKKAGIHLDQNFSNFVSIRQPEINEEEIYCIEAFGLNQNIFSLLKRVPQEKRPAIFRHLSRFMTLEAKLKKDKCKSTAFKPAITTPLFAPREHKELNQAIEQSQRILRRTLDASSTVIQAYGKSNFSSWIGSLRPPLLYCLFYKATIGRIP